MLKYSIQCVHIDSRVPYISDDRRQCRCKGSRVGEKYVCVFLNIYNNIVLVIKWSIKYFPARIKNFRFSVYLYNSFTFLRFPYKKYFSTLKF